MKAPFKTPVTVTDDKHLYGDTTIALNDSGITAPMLYFQGKGKLIKKHAKFVSTAINSHERNQETIKALVEALERYATCCDGCTCGDGWSHDAAIDALNALAKGESKS